MKYEITKGSEKDFEGAPEWAMVLLKHNNGRCVFAESKSKGAKRTEMYSDGYCIIVVPNEYEIIAERRPITEPVVWLNLDECDGSEYLGPVIGKEMECHAKDGSIFVVVVVAFDGDLPIVKTRLHGNYFGCDPSQLKPIRSPEDVAKDEAIAKMISILNEGTSTQDDARDIYDAIAAGKIPGVKLE